MIARHLAGERAGRYVVVRVADEIVIDLVARAGGIDYHEAVKDSERLTLDGVSIPLASAETLIRTKNTSHDLLAARHMPYIGDESRLRSASRSG